MLTEIRPAELPAPRGYAHGLLAAPGSRLLFLAGQIGGDATGRLAPDFAGQFLRALDNLLAVVRAAGGRPEHLAQLTIFVLDRAEYLAARPSLGEGWRGRLGRHDPAVALVEVAALVEPQARVEIQGIAALPPAP